MAGMERETRRLENADKQPAAVETMTMCAILSAYPLPHWRLPPFPPSLSSPLPLSPLFPPSAPLPPASRKTREKANDRMLHVIGDSGLLHHKAQSTKTAARRF